MSVHVGKSYFDVVDLGLLYVNIKHQIRDSYA